MFKNQSLENAPAISGCMLISTKELHCIREALLSFTRIPVPDGVLRICTMT